MNPTQLTIALFVAPFLLSGSVLWWIGKYHPTRKELERVADDLDKLGGKVNVMKEEIRANHAIAQEAMRRADQASGEVTRQHEHIERNLVGPIKEMAAQLSEVKLKQVEQAATAKFVEQTLREIKDWMYEDDDTHRRR